MVELGRWRDVAARIAAAHCDDPLHPLDDARLLARGERDVGIGTHRHERDRPGLMRHDGVDDEIHGMALVEVEGGGRQHRPVQPGLAIDLDGQHLVADHRGG
jgi:hypothetical protein